MLFFTVYDDAHGVELWKSDGTAAGTMMVKDVRPGTVGSYPLYLTAVGQKLVFAADDGAHGQEVWASDGTAAGTVMIADLVPGPKDSYPTALGIVDGTFYFADGGAPQSGLLWTSDGTAAGTRPVPGTADNALSPVIIPLVKLPAGLLVEDNDRIHGMEMYVVTAAPPNQPPVTASIADRTAYQGDLLKIQVVATDPDAGQTLVYSVDPSAPARATIDPKTGAFSWAIPATQPPGRYPFTIRVTDSGSPPLSATATFAITVNQTRTPPVLNPIANQVVAPGSPLTVQVTATNPNPGDPLVYGLGNDAPAGASIDAGSGVISWTPSSAQAGKTFMFTVMVTDALWPNLTNTKTLTIVVLAPPQVVSVSAGHVKKKGTNVINVFFNESMLPAAAGAAGNYILVTPIPVRGKKAHGPKSKPVSFTARYNATNNSVVLTLRKPTKDHLQLTVRTSVSGANGLTLGGDYTVKVQ
jgi:ELWxxDGT repeat protein